VGRIDGLAGSILGTARQVDDDVRLINTNLNVTLDLVDAVKADTGGILGQAGGANDTAACIDRKLFGQAGDDGDCQGQPTPTSQGAAAPLSTQQLRSLEDLGERGAPPSREPSSEPAPPATPGSDPSDPVPAEPEPGQPTLPPVPDVAPPAGPLDDVLDGLLPGLGQPQDRSQGQPQDEGQPQGVPPGDLLERLVRGLGQN